MMNLRAFSSQIRAMALNVWLESLRDRLLHVLVGGGVVLLFFSLSLGEMFVGGRERILQSFGFWMLGIWGLAAVMYLGSGILKREFQQKTIYLILSRPVGRTTFLVGKFCGMLLVLMTAFVLLTILWLPLLEAAGVEVRSQHVWAVLYIFLEWVLLAGMSLFFASFTSPMLHNFFLVGITFLGHWSRDIEIFARNAESPLSAGLLKALYFVLPNLEALSFREAALYGDPLSAGLLLKGAGVFAGWILVFLFAAAAVFQKRRLL
jgi:ABC-type transport system involved in multi-copper enzyme maturation permease subunit